MHLEHLHNCIFMRLSAINTNNKVQFRLKGSVSTNSDEKSIECRPMTQYKRKTQIICCRFSKPCTTDSWKIVEVIAFNLKIDIPHLNHCMLAPIGVCVGAVKGEQQLDDCFWTVHRMPVSAKPYLSPSPLFSSSPSADRSSLLGALGVFSGCSGCLK